MSFTTASALLRGIFLMPPEYAKQHLPLILELIKGGSLSTQSPRPGHEASAADPQSQVPKQVRMHGGAKADVYSIYPYQSTDRLPYGSIAMVDITGAILKYGDYCSYGSVDYADLITRLANSDRVQGVIMNIDSPGGQAAGTGTFFDAARNCLDRKPIISFIQDGMAASAGYWYACGGQEIYCARSTDMVGSIGAYCTLYDFAEWFKMNGIDVKDIYAPQSTDKNKDYKDAIAGDDSGIKAQLKVLVDDFIKCVNTSRAGRIKTDANNEPFTGKMYFPAQAKTLGLIDGVKTLPAVVQRITSLINLRK